MIQQLVSSIKNTQTCRTGFLATVNWSCLEEIGGVPEKTA